MNTKTFRMVCGIILWSAATLLAAFAVWALLESANIISQAKAAGQLAGGGSGYVIASFYMSNSLIYLVYALTLAALGLLLQKKDTITASRVEDHQAAPAIERQKTRIDQGGVKDGEHDQLHQHAESRQKKEAEDDEKGDEGSDLSSGSEDTDTPDDMGDATIE